MRCESEKNIRNYVGKCKRWREKKRKGFYGRIKNIWAKKNFKLPTLLQLHPGWVRSTTPQKP